MKVQEFVSWGKTKLAHSQIQCADPSLHMKQIVAAAMDWEMSDVHRHWDDDLPRDTAREAIEKIVQRRSLGEPFQYILGFEWFWKSKFSVGPGALIPRKETEFLVEALLSQASDSLRVAELGPGTGNIAISVLREKLNWEWWAFEKNPNSLPYLSQNRDALLDPHASLFVREGDFFEEAPKNAPYDLIVSNPPYVKAGEIAGLAKEIHHEPRLALDGGEDGLDVIRHLAESADGLLVTGGQIVTEIGAGQLDAVREVFGASGLNDFSFVCDYSGIPRVCMARKRTS